LLQLKVDVLVTAGTPATRAAQQATSTIPIVMLTVLDPVHAGFVNTLAHPGGNITGSTDRVIRRAHPEKDRTDSGSDTEGVAGAVG